MEIIENKLSISNGEEILNNDIPTTLVRPCFTLAHHFSFKLPYFFKAPKIVMIPYTVER